MTAAFARQRYRAPANRADVLALQTASGASVELMRTSYRTQTFPRHAHEYLTLGVILRGVGTIWWAGSNHAALPGDVVVIPAGEVHTGAVGRQTPALSYVAVHVPGELLASYAQVEDLKGGRVPEFAPLISRDRALRLELERLDAAMQRVDHDAAGDALSMALELLVQRCAEAARSIAAHASTREPKLVQIARDIIEDCYADSAQTSLRALAQMTGVTPFHLVRVFTHTVGLSPHRYLIQTRIRRARQFLVNGVPSSFVAAMTGFVDQSHLTTQFKRYVGITPAFYQRCMTASRDDPRDAETIPRASLQADRCARREGPEWRRPANQRPQ
jgi:AraC-like DNA-binding protein/quercetin dioxygenase-like cupin family protein